MACESWRGRVQAYVDAGLSESEERDFGAHLKSCSSCAAEALALLRQKRLTQAAGKRYSANPEFRRRIEATVVARSRPPSQGAWFRNWAPRVAVAAVLLVSLVTLYAWRQRTEGEEILGEVADLHVTVLASSNPVDVVSSDRHTVKPWFQGRLPFSFDLPELQNSPFTLLGGRVAYLEHEPGAHLVYEVRKHKISVFIFRDADALGRLKGRATREVLSFNTESWTNGGLRYFVIGDASPQDIQSLAEMHKAAASRRPTSRKTDPGPGEAVGLVLEYDSGDGQESPILRSAVPVLWRAAEGGRRHQSGDCAHAGQGAEDL